VDAYIGAHFVSPALVAKWNSLVTGQKEAALIRAAQLLDRHVKWTGDIASDTQALSWPRAWVLDRYGREIASTIIPTFLKEFQIETALWIIDQAGLIPQVGNSEFESVRVGTLEIDFNEQGGVRRSLLPEEVVAALRPMGVYYAETPGTPKTVSLLRA
jgi:hypothetical protein